MARYLGKVGRGILIWPLLLFKKGALKTVVMNKWENLKLKAELAQSPEPDLENFSRTVKFQYSIIEAKDAREVASRAPPSEDKSKGKRTMDESINSIGLDARPCFQFTNSGTCKRGADCPFAHDPAFKKQKASDTPDTSKPDGKGKGVKGKGTGRGSGKGVNGKGLKGGKPGKGNFGSRPEKGPRGPTMKEHLIRRFLTGAVDATKSTKAK